MRYEKNKVVNSMRHILFILMFLTCQLCAGQEADSTGLPQKPIFIDVQLNGELNWEHQKYYEQKFRFTLTTHNAKHVYLLFCFETDYPDNVPLDYFTPYIYPDSCIKNDTIVLEGYWDHGEAYAVWVSNDYGWVTSDTIYTNDYISQEILDLIYGPVDIEAVETPVGKEGISIGPLTLRCPSPAQLCNLQGRTVEPVDTGGGLLFRVPRHGVYLLRMRQAGRWVARKVAL